MRGHHRCFVCDLVSALGIRPRSPRLAGAPARPCRHRRRQGARPVNRASERRSRVRLSWGSVPSRHQCHQSRDGFLQLHKPYHAHNRVATVRRWHRSIHLISGAIGGFGATRLYHSRSRERRLHRAAHASPERETQSSLESAPSRGLPSGGHSTNSSQSWPPGRPHDPNEAIEACTFARPSAPLRVRPFRLTP